MRDESDGANAISLASIVALYSGDNDHRARQAIPLLSLESDCLPFDTPVLVLAR